MNVHELDAIVARHDLNQHPFYRAWRAGTLPRAKLAEYAGEYAPFIESIELGWARLGHADHAGIEREHARLWARFRDVLGPERQPSCAEAAALVDEAHRAFADRAESIGALYAFEAQQPSTAQSKLEGLRAHYAIAEEAATYFRIHADDYGERETLRGLATSLAPSDYDRAVKACARMAEGMWSALSGILGDCPAALESQS
jgi:pyrroloquinoline-quinone synthase